MRVQLMKIKKCNTTCKYIEKQKSRREGIKNYISI